MSYGSVKMAPLLYQDYALRLTTTVDGARDGEKRFEMVMASKALEVNIDKSVYLLAGRKKNVEKIRQELEREPLLYKGSKIKERKTEKWLGQMINGAGLKESTISTINERMFRIFNIINETISIVEDSRMNRLGSLRCGNW